MTTLANTLWQAPDWQARFQAHDGIRTDCPADTTAHQLGSGRGLLSARLIGGTSSCAQAAAHAARAQSPDLIFNPQFAHRLDIRITATSASTAGVMIYLLAKGALDD